MESPWEDWLKTSHDLLASLMQSTSSLSSFAPKEGAAPNRYSDSLETMMKRFQSATAAMNDPKMAEAVLQGVNAMPEIFLKLAKAGWESSALLQRKMMEKAGKIGQKTEAYKFEGLDQDLFRTWKEIYEEEFRQYLNIPPLGLTRYQQERFQRFIDQMNLFDATLSEFLFVLYLPLEKSFKVLQDQIEERSKEGKPPETSKEYYNLWIKILEGHYMNLFKSEEYLRILHETLSQTEQFTVAKNRFIADLLQVLPVPTNKDMDELYKDLYLLKKRVRVLERKLERSGHGEEPSTRRVLKVQEV
jgi:class III poly(R)-hydroxyalkanoic acid synthase PhaE subunit